MLHQRSAKRHETLAGAIKQSPEFYHQRALEKIHNCPKPEIATSTALQPPRNDKMLVRWVAEPP